MSSRIDWFKGSYRNIKESPPILPREIARGSEVALEGTTRHTE